MDHYDCKVDRVHVSSIGREPGSWRIDDLVVVDGSDPVGRTLLEADLGRCSDGVMLAARDRTGEHTCNPGADSVIEKDTALIVLGPLNRIRELRRSDPQARIGAGFEVVSSAGPPDRMMPHVIE